MAKYFVDLLKKHRPPGDLTLPPNYEALLLRTYLEMDDLERWKYFVSVAGQQPLFEQWLRGIYEKEGRPLVKWLTELERGKKDTIDIVVADLLHTLPEPRRRGPSLLGWLAPLRQRRTGIESIPRGGQGRSILRRPPLDLYRAEARGQTGERLSVEEEAPVHLVGKRLSLARPRLSSVSGSTAVQPPPRHALETPSVGMVRPSAPPAEAVSPARSVPGPLSAPKAEPELAEVETPPILSTTEGPVSKAETELVEGESLALAIGFPEEAPSALKAEPELVESEGPPAVTAAPSTETGLSPAPEVAVPPEPPAIAEPDVVPEEPPTGTDAVRWLRERPPQQWEEAPESVAEVSQEAPAVFPTAAEGAPALASAQGNGKTRCGFCDMDLRTYVEREAIPQWISFHSLTRAMMHRFGVGEASQEKGTESALREDAQVYPWMEEFPTCRSCGRSFCPAHGQGLQGEEVTVDFSGERARWTTLSGEYRYFCQGCGWKRRIRAVWERLG